jgi:hypothetical protein
MVKLTFDETMELLLGRHTTNMGGTEVWVDWDAIYADLIEEEGYESADASFLLDEYMEKNGY